MHVSVHHVHVPGGQRTSDPLALEFCTVWASTWMLRIVSACVFVMCAMISIGWKVAERVKEA